MTEQELQDALKGFLDEALAVVIGRLNTGDIEVPVELEDLIRVSTFEEEGVLTNNKGITLRFKGGAAFQMSIVRSR